MSTASATKTEENAGGILLARQGRIKDVPYVLSNLFYDDVDDPILTRSKTWLRRNGRDGNSVTSVDVASTSRNDDDVDQANLQASHITNPHKTSGHITKSNIDISVRIFIIVFTKYTKFYICKD